MTIFRRVIVDIYWDKIQVARMYNGARKLLFGRCQASHVCRCVSWSHNDCGTRSSSCALARLLVLHAPPPLPESSAISSIRADIIGGSHEIDDCRHQRSVCSAWR